MRGLNSNLSKKKCHLNEKAHGSRCVVQEPGPASEMGLTIGILLACPSTSCGADVFLIHCLSPIQTA